MRDVLLAFERPEHQTRLLEIEQEAGSDLVKLLQDRLPFAAEIQQEVIKSHGFSDDGAGIPTQVIYQSNLIKNKMYGLYIFDKVGVTSYNNIKINLLEDLIMLVFVNIWQRRFH